MLRYVRLEDLRLHEEYIPQLSNKLEALMERRDGEGSDCILVQF